MEQTALLLVLLFPICHAKTSYHWSPLEDDKCWQHEEHMHRRMSTDSHDMSFLAISEASKLRSGKSRRQDWDPKSPDDLSAKYDEIFAPSHNRNAASHLWAEYILSRSEHLSHEQIMNLFSWFCPVSGSPLGEPSAQSTYRTTLDKAGGSGSVTGLAYHCCWPCSCDMKDLIKVDTKKITDKSGDEKEYNFHVIGDPCKDNPGKCDKEGESGCIPFEAPAVTCKDGKLEKAIRSDGDHIIIGMFFPESNAQNEQYVDFETQADEDGNTLKGACAARESEGFNSGMGAIFQQVAKLNPI